jgi:hypothetical protein
VGFFLFACNDFDEGLHIFKSNNIDFHCVIKRNVLPNIIKIFDVQYKENKLQILSNYDDEFIIDQIILTEQTQMSLKKVTSMIFNKKVNLLEVMNEK